MFSLGKFRPSFGLCLGTGVDETVLNSFGNPPATPPLKPKTTEFSSPKVRQTGKNLLSFRNPSSTNVNPIVALHSDSSVQLTSFRKVTQEKDSSMIPHQSDSDLISKTSDAIGSNRLEKQTSRHSLPDVNVFQRNEISVVVSPDDDEKVLAASTFGDSSLKSKVLQASFRGKTNTMDRRTAIRTQSKRTSTSTRHFVTTTNSSLDSVLNLTLQIEQEATADLQRRQTISTEQIDPVLLNGFTHEENHQNAIETNSNRIQLVSSSDQQTIE